MGFSEAWRRLLMARFYDEEGRVRYSRVSGSSGNSVCDFGPEGELAAHEGKARTSKRPLLLAAKAAQMR